MFTITRQTEKPHLWEAWTRNLWYLFIFEKKKSVSTKYFSKIVFNQLIITAIVKKQKYDHFKILKVYWNQATRICQWTSLISVAGIGLNRNIFIFFILKHTRQKYEGNFWWIIIPFHSKPYRVRFVFLGKRIAEWLKKATPMYLCMCRKVYYIILYPEAAGR